MNLGYQDSPLGASISVVRWLGSLVLTKLKECVQGQKELAGRSCHYPVCQSNDQAIISVDDENRCVDVVKAGCRRDD